MQTRTVVVVVTLAVLVVSFAFLDIFTGGAAGTAIIPMIGLGLLCEGFAFWWNRNLWDARKFRGLWVRLPLYLVAFWALTLSLTPNYLKLQQELAPLWQEFGEKATLAQAADEEVFSHVDDVEPCEEAIKAGIEADLAWSATYDVLSKRDELIAKYRPLAQSGGWYISYDGDLYSNLYYAILPWRVPATG